MNGLTAMNSSTTAKRLPNADVGGRELGELPTIRFGTDGWRAIIAREFTFANLERVAQAYADYINRETQSVKGNLTNQLASSNSEGLQRNNQPSIVIGYDCRFMSENFAQRVAEVLRGNNIRARLFASDVPTPLVSWAVRETSAAGGVMITASHNPPLFNGFKIKAPFGGSAPPQTTREIEKLIDAQPSRRADDVSSESNVLDDETLASATATYRRAIENYVDTERLRALNARVIIDPMHGSGGRWVESFLAGGRLQVGTIRAHRDPLFGGVNPEPIDSNLSVTKMRVREQGALVALVTDGDADRVGAVSEQGETMTMHEVVPLILLHLARRRGMTGGIVRTFSQSVLLKRIAAALNLKLYETPIGFKYIADLMLKDDILIGAEESGGIGVKNHIPERDGILNSLLFLEAIAAAGKSPSAMVKEMHAEFGAYYFGRVDLHQEVARGQALVRHLAEQTPSAMCGEKVIGVSTMDGTKLMFDDESWLLFRQSGTEPALRIYAEATSTAKLHRLLEAGRNLANTGDDEQ